MSWAAVAGISAIASVGMGVYSLATAPGAPGTPDMAAANRAGVEADAETLPERRRLEAAAQQGGKTTYTTAAHTEKKEMPYVRVKGAKATAGNLGGSGLVNALMGGNLVPYVESEWQPGGKYYEEGQKTPEIVYRTQKVKVPGGVQEADFTGYGEADVQSKIARDMAQIQLELQQKYGVDFIEEAKKQLELADPEGKLARDKMLELIQAQAESKPDRPVADLLDTQVTEQLAAGKGLDRMSSELLAQAVAEAQAGRGEAGPGFGEQGADFSDPLTSGFAGQARLDAAQQKALGWLTSGATPEDVQYRREQQDIANLAAFSQGRTPQSQFQTLSGAQSGPAPMYTGQPLATQNQNAGSAMQSAQLQGWGTQMNYEATQANPWMAGLSTLLSGLNVAGNAGWQPLAKQT